MLSVIPSVGPLPNTERLFAPLSAVDDEFLSTPKITTSVVESLRKPHEPTPSNAIPRPLHY